MKKFIKKKNDNKNGSNNQDTSKNQISLALGSDEYKERVEDLKLINPFKKDDKFHKDFEEKYENELYKDKELMREFENQVKLNYDKYIKKNSKFNAIKDKATSLAELTEDKSDDVRAKKFSKKKYEDFALDKSISYDNIDKEVLKELEIGG